MDVWGFVLVLVLVVVLIAIAPTGVYRTPWGPYLGLGGALVVATVCILLGRS
jgi:hypothetical protein